jgi:hypothetical protein
MMEGDMMNQEDRTRVRMELEAWFKQYRIGIADAHCVMMEAIANNLAMEADSHSRLSEGVYLACSTIQSDAKARYAAKTLRNAQRVMIWKD